MRNYEELPFGRRIPQFIIANSGYAQEFRSFGVATRAERKVFDYALSAAKFKSHSEAHEAVASAVAV